MPLYSTACPLPINRKILRRGASAPSVTPPSLLLHMNGGNGSTTFTDNSLNGFTVTANGDAQISTAQSKYGGSSGYFDGDGDYLSVPDNSLFNLQLQDFTIETWLYMQGTGLQIIVAKWDADGTNAWQIYYNNEELVLQGPENTFTAFGLINLNQWTHVAITRTASNFRFFIDGILIDTLFTEEDDLFGTANLSVGANDAGLGGANFYNGYMNDLRIIKGQALYTASFTPPTSQLPNP